MAAVSLTDKSCKTQHRLWMISLRIDFTDMLLSLLLCAWRNSCISGLINIWVYTTQPGTSHDWETGI